MSLTVPESARSDSQQPARAPASDRATAVPAEAVRYRPDIDGLRAVAVLSILAYHMDPRWLPGGFVGVDVFFVISGFVVAGSLAASRATSALAYIGEFYARRLARILPALVLVLCVSALLATMLVPRAWLSGLSERTALYAFAGLSNWVMQHNNDTYFAPRAEFNPYTHTWSLGVEEQFYLVAPLIVFLWLWGVRNDRSSRLHRGVLGVLLLLCAASVFGCCRAMNSQPTAAFYFLGFRFWELGLGVSLYLATAGRAPNPSPAAAGRLVAPILGALLIAAGCAFAGADRFPWPWAVAPVLGTLLVIGGAHADPRAPVRRLLSAVWLLWVGKRSYSLYLWHWPVFVLLRWTAGFESLGVKLLAFAASVQLAALSYRFVETPLRHHPLLERWRPRYRVAFFLAFGALGWWLARHVFSHHDRYSLSSVTRNAGDWYAGMRMQEAVAAERACRVELQYHAIAGGLEYRYVPRKCRGVERSGRVHVLGDSHATAYLPLFEQLSAETGRKISVYTFPGCPCLELQRPMATGRSQQCQDFTRTIKERLLEQARAGDVLFLPSLRLPRYADQWMTFAGDPVATVYDPASFELRQAAAAEAVEWLRPFADKGAHIVFDAPKPIFKAPTFRCADWFNRSNPICVGDNRQPRAELERLRAPMVATLASVSGALSGVSLWDPFPVLCPADECLTFDKGRPLFFDGDHLSGYANALLYPHFKKHLEKALGAALTRRRVIAPAPKGQEGPRTVRRKPGSRRRRT